MKELIHVLEKNGCNGGVAKWPVIGTQSGRDEVKEFVSAMIAKGCITMRPPEPKKKGYLPFDGYVDPKPSDCEFMIQVGKSLPYKFHKRQLAKEADISVNKASNTLQEWRRMGWVQFEYENPTQPCGWVRTELFGIKETAKTKAILSEL